MISQIKGVLIEKQAPDIVVDVNGVGYEILVPMTTLFRLPEIGQELGLFTHFVVREDAQILFGFASKADRALFRDLIKVNGVGPKMALAILSGMEKAEFVRAVHDNDVATLVKLPGVGKKTAERLLIEMRDKLKHEALDSQGTNPSASASLLAADPITEAESALVALGYKPAEASKTLARIKTPDMDSEALIRAALKSML